MDFTAISKKIWGRAQLEIEEGAPYPERELEIYNADTAEWGGIANEVWIVKRNFRKADKSKYWF